MKNISFDLVVKRLLVATNSRSFAALGRALGISSQAVYEAKKRGVVPSRWIYTAVTKYGLNEEDLLAPECGHSEKDESRPAMQQLCFANNIDKLNKELALEREERRLLADENRQLYRKCMEQEKLIGDLRLALQTERNIKRSFEAVENDPSDSTGTAACDN